MNTLVSDEPTCGDGISGIPINMPYILEKHSLVFPDGSIILADPDGDMDDYVLYNHDRRAF